MTRTIVLFSVLSSLLWASLGLAQTPAVRLQDEGVTQGFVDTLNCTGAGLACSKSGGIGIINGSGGAGAYATIQDEATPLTQRATVNFTGAGVACVDNGGSTRTDCTIAGGSGAPTTVPYWTGAADATLSAEHNLGALGTGLVLNTAGTPSILAGNTCAANNFGITISASGALACAQPLFSNLSGSATDAQIPNNITIDLATLASTATALAADPADCAVNNFASSINASGTLGCSQPVLSTDTTGNYLASSTSGAGITGATTASHGGTITPAFDYTSTLAGNPAMNAGESRFSTTGIMLEGATANLLETLITVTDPTVDRTFTIPDADSNPVIPDTGTANNFLTAISAGGVISKAQPAFSNLSGSATDAQVPDNITVTLAATATALAADPADCGANQYAASINASGTLGCTQPAFSNLSGSATDAQVPDNITVTLAGTATALAADPADCSGNNFALGIVASGAATCAQPAFTNLSGSATDAQVPDTISLTNLTQVATRQISDTTGTLAISRGGTGQTTTTTNQLYVGTALDTLAAKTLPSCSNATTSKLLYDNATQTFSCGTDQTGGGGGVNVVEVSLSLGTAMGLYYSTTVTGQAWVTSSSVVACSMFGTTADSQTPETIAVAGMQPSVSDRVVGVGFNLNVANPNGATGTVRAHCHGA